MNKKTKKGYSLLEVIISLTIIVVIFSFLSAILINGLKINLTVLVKNNIREELSALVNQIDKDVRDLTEVIQCGSIEGIQSCTIKLGNNIVKWYKCQNSVCMEKNNVKLIQSSPNLNITDINFETSQIAENQSIVITIQASIMVNNQFINVIEQREVTSRIFSI